MEDNSSSTTTITITLPPQHAAQDVQASSVATLEDNSRPECYICRDEGMMEPLMQQTCLCHALVHRSCIEKWVSTKNTLDCPICRRSFELLDHNKQRGKCWKLWHSSMCKKIAGVAILLFAFVASLVLSWVTGSYIQLFANLYITKGS